MAFKIWFLSYDVLLNKFVYPEIYFLDNLAIRVQSASAVTEK